MIERRWVDVQIFDLKGCFFVVYTRMCGWMAMVMVTFMGPYTCTRVSL